MKAYVGSEGLTKPKMVISKGKLAKLMTLIIKVGKFKLAFW